MKIDKYIKKKKNLPAQPLHFLLHVQEATTVHPPTLQFIINTQQEEKIMCFIQGSFTNIQSKFREKYDYEGIHVLFMPHIFSCFFAI